MLFRLAVGDDPNSWTGLGSTVAICFAGVVTVYAGLASYEEKLKNAKPAQV